MHDRIIHTLDLKFMGTYGAIASYLIPHSNGAVLIECGPGSTLDTLIETLEYHGFKPGDVTDVFLTHIHLDHAGAAGWLAQQGARIYVHPIGAPHLHNPEKLLASAERIYGDMMGTLWGEFLPVPSENLIVLQDRDIVEIDGMSFEAINTPGHANHHFVYLLDNVCFSGDIGGIRLAGLHRLRIPMPPPEFNLEKWRSSLSVLRSLDIQQIAPTHFGVYSDPSRHLDALAIELDTVEQWIESIMPGDPPLEALTDKFLSWVRERAIEDGLNLEHSDVFELANPSWMSPLGIMRYWHKYRLRI